MANFPTLSRAPGRNLDPDGDIEDVNIRSKMESGYEQVRPRTTRARRTYGVNYPNLGATDTAALRTFEQVTLKNGADFFTWTHPVDNTSHVVRFVGPVNYKKTSSKELTTVSFKVREV